MHWLAMAHGAASQSIPIVTAYDTLGEEGLTSSLQATRARLMFLDAYLLRTLIVPLRKAKFLEVIVYDKEEDLVKEDLDALLEAHPRLKVIGFEELRQAGVENPTDPVPPSSEDTCCIMYTSGSTGSPKGVTIKHKAIVASSKNPSHVTPQNSNFYSRRRKPQHPQHVRPRRCVRIPFPNPALLTSPAT